MGDGRIAARVSVGDGRIASHVSVGDGRIAVRSVWEWADSCTVGVGDGRIGVSVWELGG